MHRAGVMDMRLLRHEASSSYHCRSNQRHPAGNGAGGGAACLWRTPERVSVDWRAVGDDVVLHVE